MIAFYMGSQTITASTMGSEVTGKSGEKAETSHVKPVSSKTKQAFPRTTMLACESNSVLAILFV